LHSNDSSIISLLHQPAIIIQRCYRSHLDRRIFQYYKQLCYTLSYTGSRPLDSVHLLSTLHGHAASAASLDAAAMQYIRFRLGGLQWPPTVYWRVATRLKVVDVGSFAPRDYAAERQSQIKTQFKLKSSLHNKTKSTKQTSFIVNKRPTRDDWYKRWTNNGWTPLQDQSTLLSRMQMQQQSQQQHQQQPSQQQQQPYVHQLIQRHEQYRDAIQQKSHAHVVVHHPNRQIRAKISQKQKQQQKSRWIQSLYSNSQKIVVAATSVKSPPQSAAVLTRNEKLDCEEHKYADNESESQQKQQQQHQEPQSAPLLHDDDDEFDDDIEQEPQLLEWAAQLDFDSYLNDWQQTAVTGIETSEPVPEYLYDDTSHIVAQSEAQRRVDNIIKPVSSKQQQQSNNNSRINLSQSKSTLPVSTSASTSSKIAHVLTVNCCLR
jgi:hypothetical protein